MTSVQHINTKAGAESYKALFSKVTIVPPNTSIAYISTKWACDPETGDVVKGAENDVDKQSKIIWENINATLRELGAEMKDVVHRIVCFMNWSDEIGKAAVENAIAATPAEWKKDVFASSLMYRGVSHFHSPGIVYAMDVVVAIPNRQVRSVASNFERCMTSTFGIVIGHHLAVAVACLRFTIWQSKNCTTFAQCLPLIRSSPSRL